MKAKIIFTLFLMLVCVPFGANAAYLTEKADSAYNAKEYKEAIALYRGIMEEKGTSPELLYNLGNAYYQDGDYGNAMVCWERAHKLAPSNAEINANINYLRNRVEDFNKAEQKGKRLKVTPDEGSFFQSVHSAIAVNTSSNRWAVTAAIMFILFVAAAATYVFSRNVLARKVGFFGGLCCILCCVMLLTFSFMGAREQNSEEDGIILPFKVTLLTEPGKSDDGNRGGVLTKGTKVQILSEESDAAGNVTWYKVRLNSDYIGWVAASDLEVI